MEGFSLRLDFREMNITLIGMAGVGKSFIGQELARVLHYGFIDIDEMIEKKFNRTLQEIVDHFGEQRFLKIEEQAILDLGDIDHCVISPGGSAVYSIKAMEFLRNNSLMIFLDASFESIKHRVHNESTRGIIGLKNRKLKDLYLERRPLYQKYSEITVTLADDLDKGVVVKEILQKLPPLRVEEKVTV